MAKPARKIVPARLTTPTRTKISWCGMSDGVNASALEKINAAAPRSNMRSTVYTAIWLGSETVALRATR